MHEDRPLCDVEGSHGVRLSVRYEHVRGPAEFRGEMYRPPLGAGANERDGLDALLTLFEVLEEQRNG
jgi:hypothetical protein